MSTGRREELDQQLSDQAGSEHGRPFAGTERGHAHTVQRDQCQLREGGLHIRYGIRNGGELLGERAAEPVDLLGEHLLGLGGFLLEALEPCTLFAERLLDGLARAHGRLDVVARAPQLLVARGDGARERVERVVERSRAGVEIRGARRALAQPTSR